MDSWKSIAELGPNNGRNLQVSNDARPEYPYCLYEKMCFCKVLCLELGINAAKAIIPLAPGMDRDILGTKS